MSADKHNVRKGVDIVFADDVVRTIYPLTLKSLRKFVKIVNQMKNLDDMTELSDEEIDRMVDAISIVLEKIDPKLAADRDALEETLDIQSFGKVMSVAMGASSPEE